MEQVVVPVAAGRPADLHDQPVCTGKRIQAPARIGLLRDGLRDRRLDDLEHRAPREERHVVVVEVVQQLRADVLRDECVVARDVGHRPSGGTVPRARERRKVDGGGPALRPPDQRRRCILRDLEAGRRSQRSCLPGVELQVGLPDLEKPSRGPEACDRQVGEVPSGQHDLDVGREMVQERGQGVEARLVGEPVDVVQHDDGRLLDAVELDSETRHRRGQDAGPGRADRLLHARIEGMDPPDGHRDIGEEDARDVVEVVEGQPCDGPPVPCRPVREEHRSCRSRAAPRR